MQASSAPERIEEPSTGSFTQHYQQSVQPFWQNQVVEGHFSGVDDVDIHYAYVLHPKARGSVAISSGRIEAYVKYKELVFELFQAGYSVFIHDHRGQGYSGRMTDNPHQGFVRDFDHFVQDFKTFYDLIVKPNSSSTPMLLCHSMGGAIGALYLLKYPKDFSKAMFCAPMFGIQPALPFWFGHILVGLHGLLSRAGSYFWGQGDYDPEPFDSNELTHCPERYQTFLNEYEQNPQVRLGGITGVWLGAALNAMATIRARASDITVPVMLLQAGADTIVDNGGQDIVAARLPNVEKIPVAGARHEILMEAEQYRSPAIEKVKRFFATG